MDEDLIARAMNWRTSELPRDIRLAMDFTERWIADHADSVDEAFLDELRSEFSDEELIELAVMAGTVELSHKFNAVFGVEPVQSPYTVGTPSAPDFMKAHLASKGIYPPERK